MGGMFRIRRVYDALFSRNIRAFEQIRAIYRQQFPDSSDVKLESAIESLKNPMAYKYRTILYIAEDMREEVVGFAVFSHLPDVDAGFLDYLAAKESAPGGIGSSLYERVREESSRLDTAGLFFECLSDEPAICGDPSLIGQNRSRLKFYEYYGARPIIGTAYETPVSAVDTCPPSLLYDDLDTGNPLRRGAARKIVRAVLRRKYGDICDEAYVRKVADSIRDDPVRIREPRYMIKKNHKPKRGARLDNRIALLVNRHHEIHHIRERGYVEAPVRVKTILDDLRPTRLFHELPARPHSERVLRQIHDKGYLDYLKRVCLSLPPGKSVYPYVFPIRNVARPPKDLSMRAGYYCIDTFTPLNANAYRAARGAVDTVLSAADLVLDGRDAAYALVRPPGHHVERRSFGGFCYFNSAAAAAQLFSRYGRTAILDLDYHHGNGQQDIFYDRPDVFTVSIHGHPEYAYPYFSGFRDETGEGEGRGYNLNIPLSEGTDGPAYQKALKTALAGIRSFRPAFLVVCLGLDTAKGDPTGTWLLRSKDFSANGALVGAMGLPSLIVQEGGYDNRVLGSNARAFFQGFAGVRGIPAEAS
jgi:acetoin utilization deacetylase AcuC-like enzyme